MVKKNSYTIKLSNNGKWSEKDTDECILAVNFLKDMIRKFTKNPTVDNFRKILQKNTQIIFKTNPNDDVCAAFLQLYRQTNAEDFLKASVDALSSFDSLVPEFMWDKWLKSKANCLLRIKEAEISLKKHESLQEEITTYAVLFKPIRMLTNIIINLLKKETPFLRLIKNVDSTINTIDKTSQLYPPFKKVAKKFMKFLTKFRIAAEKLEKKYEGLPFSDKILRKILSTYNETVLIPIMEMVPEYAIDEIYAKEMWELVNTIYKNPKFLEKL